MEANRAKKKEMGLLLETEKKEHDEMKSRRRRAIAEAYEAFAASDVVSFEGALQSLRDVILAAAPGEEVLPVPHAELIGAARTKRQLEGLQWGKPAAAKFGEILRHSKKLGVARGDEEKDDGDGGPAGGAGGPSGAGSAGGASECPDYDRKALNALMPRVATFAALPFGADDEAGGQPGAGHELADKIRTSPIVAEATDGDGCVQVGLLLRLADNDDWGSGAKQFLEKYVECVYRGVRPDRVPVAVVADFVKELLYRAVSPGAFVESLGDLGLVNERWASMYVKSADRTGTWA